MKNLLFTVLFVFFASLFINATDGAKEPVKDSPADSAGEAKSSSDKEYNLYEAEGNIKFYWRVSGENLDIKIQAPAKGWVAVGFNPTNKMKDANFVIGYVLDKDGSVVISDHWGIRIFGHRPDTQFKGKDNIMNPKGVQNDQYTEISCSIPLDSGDPYDGKPLGGKTKLILAYSDKDNTTSKHKFVTTGEINIEK